MGPYAKSVDTEERATMPHERAGEQARPEDLVDVARLVTAYYALHPDPAEPGQRVAFGTSGHRGSSLATAFNEDHIAATSQAICEYRADQGTDGPLFLGADTHALSEPAKVTALEVFAANEVTVLIDSADGYTPTPAVSHAILAHNRGRTSGLADGHWSKPGRTARSTELTCSGVTSLGGWERSALRPVLMSSATGPEISSRPSLSIR